MPQPSTQMPSGRRGFAEGTLVMTARGEIPVERLAPGDLVLTLSGLGPPLKPIARVVPLPAEHADALRLRRDAIAPGMPIRELVLGAGQPLRVEGMLTAAESLANGASIRAEPAPARLWVVALERHDVIIANGTPVSAWPDPAEPEPDDPARLAAIRAAIAARAEPLPAPRHPTEALLDRVLATRDGAGTGAADLVTGAAPPQGSRDG